MLSLATYLNDSLCDQIVSVDVSNTYFFVGSCGRATNDISITHFIDYNDILLLKLCQMNTNAIRHKFSDF